MMSLTTIIGPLLMTQTLGRFSEPGAAFYFPGAAFALATALGALALVLILRVSTPALVPATERT